MTSFAHLSRVEDEATRDSFRLLWERLDELQATLNRCRKRGRSILVNIDTDLTEIEQACVRQESVIKGS